MTDPQPTAKLREAHDAEVTAAHAVGCTPLGSMFLPRKRIEWESASQAFKAACDELDAKLRGELAGAPNADIPSNTLRLRIEVRAFVDHRGRSAQLPDRFEISQSLTEHLVRASETQAVADYIRHNLEQSLKLAGDWILSTPWHASLRAYLMRDAPAEPATTSPTLSELQELVGKLWNYGAHLETCDQHENGPETCDCGLSEAKRLLDTAIRKARPRHG